MEHEKTFHEILESLLPSELRANCPSPKAPLIDDGKLLRQLFVSRPVRAKEAQQKNIKNRYHYWTKTPKKKKFRPETAPKAQMDDLASRFQAIHSLPKNAQFAYLALKSFDHSNILDQDQINLKQLKSFFRQCALIFHPDSQDERRSAEAFQQLTEAYKLVAEAINDQIKKT